MASKIPQYKWHQAYGEAGHAPSFVQTASADEFSRASVAAQLTYGDEFEWHYYHKEGKVLHVDLTKKADVFVIAPCSANTLSKLANGICDNLLTCCARAWDFNKKMIIAPAMNTRMWNHPITQEHIRKLQSWGVEIIFPVEKELFCGDVGIGAMAEIKDIIAKIL